MALVRSESTTLQHITLERDFDCPEQNGNPLDSFLAKLTPGRSHSSVDGPRATFDDILEEVNAVITSPPPWMKELCELNGTNTPNAKFVAETLHHYQERKPWCIDDNKLARLHVATKSVATRNANPDVAQPSPAVPALQFPTREENLDDFFSRFDKNFLSPALNNYYIFDNSAARAYWCY